MSFKNIEIEKIDFSKSDGLVPAIVQDAKTSRVLMLGYMNEESLEKTISSQKVCFFSRSKQRLWVKGESSGNFLNVVEIGQDCDDDTLLILADPVGPTCHKGTDSCFGDLATDLTTFGDLDKLVEKKLQEKDSNSYTYSLLNKPLKAAQKVGEEGVEVSLAAAAQGKEELVSEAADLIYHLIVLLKTKGLNLSDVAKELFKRKK